MRRDRQHRRQRDVERDDMTSDDDEEEGVQSYSETTQRDVSLEPLLPEFVEDFFEGVADDAHAAPRANHGIIGSENTTLTFKVVPEAWRFIAYLTFWCMSICVICITKFLVEPRLKRTHRWFALSAL